MGYESSLVLPDGTSALAAAKVVCKIMSDAFLADFDKVVAHGSLPASTVRRVRSWVETNEICGLARYRFGGNDVVVANKAQQMVMAALLAERKEPWVAVSVEDVTTSATGLKEVAESLCGPYNLMLRTDDEGRWTGIRLPGQEAPTVCVGQVFKPAQGWGCGAFNLCAGHSAWRSEAQMREEAGTDASFQNRATKGAVGFGLMGPLTAIGAFFSPELHLGALKMANGPQALSCTEGVLYAAFRAKTGQKTMLWCVKENMVDFNMAVGENDVRKHCEEVLLAVRDGTELYVG